MVYVCEPSFEGFLTAVFKVFEDRNTENFDIRSGDDGGVLDFCGVQRVEPDTAKADRVITRLESLGIYRQVYTAYLYGGIENSILIYIRIAIKNGGSPDRMLYDDAVKTVVYAARKVGGEAHRYLQFVRFRTVSDPERKFEILTADIEPEYDILHMIACHFTRRYCSQRLLIRDMKRGKALVWDTENWHISTLPELLAPELAHDGEAEEMWRRYFERVAIPWRKNKKLQQHFIPLRFREHMTEFREM